MTERLIWILQWRGAAMESGREEGGGGEKDGSIITSEVKPVKSLNHFLHLLICRVMQRSGVALWRSCFYSVFCSFINLSIGPLKSSRQEDRSHSSDCACSNKEETGRAHPLLISLAQTLVVNGKC